VADRDYQASSNSNRIPCLPFVCVRHSVQRGEFVIQAAKILEEEQCRKCDKLYPRDYK